MADGRFFIRDAQINDINDIFELGSLLNTLNLPANKSELEQVIAQSESSFSLTENNPTKRAFLFVLVNPDNKVIGTSQIFAKHGTLDAPHSYFALTTDERYSETLNKYFRHHILRLKQSFDGPTEIGSLVLDKHYRSQPLKLGRALSFVRFLFMAQQPSFFASRVLAELLPPLGPHFESALWEAIGRKFTGLDYYEADMISRNNKEFISTLFPSGDIYVSLLPREAQEVIGKIGRNSQAAAHLLSQIGFRYSNCVDPFDGGPHFEANREDITLIRNAKIGRLITKEHLAHKQMGLVGNFCASYPSGARFYAEIAPYQFDKEQHAIVLPALFSRAFEAYANTSACAIDMVNY